MGYTILKVIMRWNSFINMVCDVRPNKDDVHRTRLTVGGDRLGSEAYSAAPHEVARLLHPLHPKAAILLRPCLQYTGGCLFEIWKGSGATDSMDRYREVAICSHGGKLYAKHNRSQLLPTVAKLTEDTQFGGGLHGGETAIAHLCLKATCQAQCI